MQRIDLRLKYKSETGKYPIRENIQSVTGVFSEDQNATITVETDDDEYDIDNPLYPLLDYIDWLEEQLTK
jgi:hypothetical protein